MKKIPTVYLRDPATKLRYVMNERHPDCGWVFDGEGTPTYKWDGTAVLIDAVGDLWKRREIKAGKDAPVNFWQEGEEDSSTGKRVGWVRCIRDDPADQWHWEAVRQFHYDEEGPIIPPGTYELVGPKVQGNPHGLDHHQLIRHGDLKVTLYPDPTINYPRDFEELGERLHRMKDRDPGFEGIVWHHPDGRMAKIKAKDFPT